ncbi:LysM peptidoglycan-binding domain-containing protein [Methylobacterium trifolii]|nr:LysM peptidoglycan-binding domain-containing protein [Methylobacterium trifolii]
MSRELWRSLALALIGLAGGLGLVSLLFGGGDLLTRLRGPGAPGDVATSAGEAPRPLASPAPETPPQAEGPDRRQAALPEAGRKPSEGNRADSTAKAGAATAPSFDIVRVEPNGESVVAGRGAPNTVVEMLVDGKPVARALADPNGQFAIVPPALAAGNSEIVLRSTAADGKETRSTQSVAVAISPKRDTRPLVALTAPDKPTVVLSQPEAPAPVAQTRPGNDRTGASSGQRAAADPRKPTTDTGKAVPLRVVSVDAQEGGRLFVTGEAAPGATVRLYLNDTLIAPASVGPDGKVTFTIGRGVKPGDYRVRIDQVDSVSGKVRTRAEVPFVVPDTGATVAARDRPGTVGNRVAARDAPAPAAPGTARPPGPAHPEPGAGAAASGPGAATGPGTAPPTKSGEPHRTEPAAAAPRADVAAATPAGPPVKAGEAPMPAARTEAEAAGKAPGAVFVAEINTARISRGNSLWQISRQIYGRGERYTVIYDANREQIRDPDLIYPGQILVLPGDKRG